MEALQSGRFGSPYGCCSGHLRISRVLTKGEACDTFYMGPRDFTEVEAAQVNVSIQQCTVARAVSSAESTWSTSPSCLSLQYTKVWTLRPAALRTRGEDNCLSDGIMSAQDCGCNREYPHTRADGGLYRSGTWQPLTATYYAILEEVADS